MYGNLHAATELNGATSGAELRLWFGLPAAREHFDASTLSASDRARRVAHRSSRRRAEFEVSRALLAFTKSEATTHSLSHSGGHAALVTAPSSLRVGVDLEVSRPRDVLRIARFAFDPSEVRALESAADGTRESLFYTLWTLKESLAKALRLDLIDALRQCVFTLTPAGWHGRAPTEMPWSAAVFQPRPGAFLAVVCVGIAEMPALSKWEWPPRQAGNWPLIAACAGAPADAAALRG